ncbi:imelysin family protein [Halomonas caseinilytica]|uniref:Imelysin. Metallo peptidase. MEROPS family M75 n=1 Tax=Halomonas caseinilytica TaxID=438744 RepID=A0A1M6NS10_9GAMM|nr:imelysin family protein [Halomonas caseinilytica]SHJ98521.1 imelysin. Metallo peptidase. MEROPS family M75 [Halomonas caseinilytica]
MPTRFAPRPLPCVIALATLFPAAAMAADGKITAEQVVGHYADLAHANYQDALVAARTLDERIDALLAEPNDATLAAARQAWREARIPYQQSEVFRFGNAVVDDWEGQLNAWPLDEGMIDYVAGDDYQHELGNAGATANIIANERIQVAGESLDVSELTPELLSDLNEIGGSEANVATGYHAIEFLLWGQDLHGFEAGNGERPASDYMSGDACTHGHCDRRGAYLDAASDLLVDDLEWMVAQWAPDQDDNYRQALLAESPEEGLRRMLFGMGSLSLGELAGERMKVALEANSVEDEHDCFSDNTHNSHYYNGQGIQNVYTGTYQRLDGSTLEGPALSDLVAAEDSTLDATLTDQLANSMKELDALKQAAEADQAPMAFDMMIAPGNERGAELVNNAILALVTQTGSIEKAAGELGVNSLQSDDAGHTF